MEARIDADLLVNGLTRYSLTPPSWRAPWLPSSSSYPQFYPTVPGQDEDQLTESAVRTGFLGKTVVQTETFSAHQLIYEKLRKDDILPSLARLAAAVAERAATRVPSYGPSTFRLPTRVVLNEQRKDAWINDLANPLVPLEKLSRNVPHGYRGDKLLDMLCVKQVKVERAVWYIRAIGGIEIQALKSRLGVTAAVAQYTLDWSLTVFEFVRKQFAEIELSESLALVEAGSSENKDKGKGKSVMQDENSRSKWTERFRYTVSLLSLLHSSHLIDRPAFLRFLVSQLECANLGQLRFVIFLVEEYQSAFSEDEGWSARLVWACLTRLNEVTSTSSKSDIHSSLTALVATIFLTLPNAFIASAIWSTYSAQLYEIILALPNDESGIAQTVLQTLKGDWADLNARNSASMGRGVSFYGEDGSGVEREQEREEEELESIKLLNLFSFPMSLSTLHKSYFHKRRRTRTLTEELSTLFIWCTTGVGRGKSYAVAALIELELADLETERAKDLQGFTTRQGAKSKASALDREKVDVERSFMDWIDRTTEWTEKGLKAVHSLLAELIRRGVLSYSLYLQRMIARGETEERGPDDGPTSLHLQLLRSVPLYGSSGASLAKRRMALRASSTARADSAQLVETGRRELLKLVPILVDNLDPKEVALDRDAGTLLVALENLAQDGSHLLLTRDLIPNGLTKALSRGAKSLTVEDHAILTEAFLVVEDYWGAFQYLAIVLHNRPSRDLVICLLDAVERHLDTWASMNVLPDLARALISAHEALRSLGINERRLISLLRLLGAAGHVEEAALTQLGLDFQALVLSLSSAKMQPQALGQISDLSVLLLDRSPQSLTSITTTLWYRYHSYENWGVVVFDTCVQLLATVPAPTIALLLRGISERLPGGLEVEIGRSFASMAPRAITALFSGPFAGELETLFVTLVLDGTVSGAVLLDTVILVAWRAALVGATTSDVTDPATLRAIECVSTLFARVIGADDIIPVSSSLVHSPAQLLERQRLASRRRSLYTHTTVLSLGRCISMLVLSQEVWTSNSQPEKALATSRTLSRFASSMSFQVSVAKDPQGLASAVLDGPFVEGIPAMPAARLKLLAALLLTLKDGSTATPASLVSTEDWDLFLSGLTSWRLAFSKVEVQACLERLDLDDSLSDAEKFEALHTLSEHFLDRVCTGMGHTYLGEEIVRCYHGRASDELVSVAFARLSVALDGLSDDSTPDVRDKSNTALRCTSRLLNTLLQSGRAHSRSAPLAKLLVSIKARLDDLLANGAVSKGDVLLHTNHLLDIALRCAPLIVSAEICEQFRLCLIPAAKLASVFARDRPSGSDLASTLLDTCSHIIFSLHKIAPTLRLPLLESIISSNDEYESLPDRIISRLTRLFANHLTPSAPNPWELVDHADPGQAKLDPGTSKETRHNMGPIDLAFFDARICEPIPLVTAFDMAHSPATTTSSHQSERGAQTNFDFETPTTGMSLEARHHRRSSHGSRSVQSRYDASKKRSVDGMSQDTPSPVGSTSASSTIPVRGATKRKDPPEVLIIDSDSDKETVPIRAPPAKRGRPASKTIGRGAARKKPKN